MQPTQNGNLHCVTDSKWQLVGFLMRFGIGDVDALGNMHPINKPLVLHFMAPIAPPSLFPLSD